jgi:hypothetical protein
MTTEPRKARLSIGIYDQADRLCSTVVKLIERGFSEEQLGLAALRSTVEKLQTATQLEIASRQRILRLLNEVHPLRDPDGGERLVSSRGPILTFLRDHGISQPLTGGGSGQMTTAMRAEIERQIREGATALAIASQTTDQQWLSTRILLEESAFPVQTHEFRLPGA